MASWSARDRARSRLVTAAVGGLSASIAGFYLFLLARSVRDFRSEAPLTPLAPLPRADDRQVSSAPRVSVIVPARDEERNISRCIKSLLAQDYANFEIIVVDDASSDSTPTLLARLLQTPEGSRLLRTIRVDCLPRGWAGKPHALQVGSQVATGDWLLFTDADTCHAPSALRAAMARAVAEDADLFTIGSSQELPDFWGRVLMPIAYMGISFMYPPSLVNDARSKVALANGQFLLIRRAFFEKLHGYDTDELRGTVVDDLALARVVKSAGGRLLLVDGRRLVRTRMYQSLREHWNGWGKNVVAGARGGPLPFLFMAAGLPVITVAPFALLAAGLLRRDRGLTLAGVAPVAAILGYRAYLDRLLGVPLRYGWTHPLGGAMFTGVLARSFWYSLRRATVPWRGRSYSA